MSGDVKPSSEQIHNAVRHNFIAETQHLYDLLKISSKTAQKSINTRLMVCGELLRLTESFAHNSWNNAAEAIEMLAFCVETIIDKGLPMYIPKIRPSSEDVRACWSEVKPNLAQNLRNAARIPEVPYRRVLGESEWLQLYVRFEERFNNGKSVFQMEAQLDKYRFDIDDYAENLFADIQDDIANSTEKMYLINYWSHNYSYELSGKWFAEMFGNSGGYWVDKQCTRFIIVDGNGFIMRGF